jgi:hypothetical protein
MAHPGFGQWVASPPPSTAPTPPTRPAVPYQGPPSYPVPPRWGFPPLVWRWPSSVPGTASAMPAPIDRVRRLARHTTGLLWLLAGLALIAAIGETWRYVLLLQSRFGALSVNVVAFSDALVTAGSVFAVVVAVLAGVTTVWWLYVARDAAVEFSGYERGRSDWQVLIGFVVPGVNLVLPGSTVAELEHAVLRRPTGQRPQPSGLVKAWWLTWIASGLMFAVTLLWRLFDSVQAKADGVILAAVTDLLASAVAVLSVLVVRRLTSLLAPIEPSSVRRMRVVDVRDAPAPQLRAVRLPGIKR